MSCWLCGREGGNSHHLGCAKVMYPNLTKAEAIKAGLLAGPTEAKAKPMHVEVLREGSMQTEVVATTCEVEGCDNPKYSDHPRVKFCEDHRDPKNRKE